ncbi:MAG: hypothetical protein E4H40_01780 [Candidatus Brocadiia bacterium]|nr:MAG: hypothetical protein E4H40_01780 [Candidatus Brocadiia bacterium]
MFRRILMILVLSGLLFAGGCKKKSSEAPAEDVVVKTSAEYEAQAQKEITEENMDSELQKIEKEMQQESSR